MFNVGPLEMVVLAIVGLIILGPDRLPGLAKDAANMLRTLRDLATTSRKHLRDELGPEFADVDFRNLNPRAMVTKAVFGDDFDPSRLNPKNAVRNAVFGDDDEVREGLRSDLRDSDPRQALRDARESLYGDQPSSTGASTSGASNNGASRSNGTGRSNGANSDAPITMTKPVSQPVEPQRARPRPRPGPLAASAPYDSDAT